MAAWSITLLLRSQTHDGPIEISVHEPKRLDDGVWNVGVMIDPYFDEPFFVKGTSALEALCLAIGHLDGYLSAFVERGDAVMYEDGSKFLSLVPPPGGRQESR